MARLLSHDHPDLDRGSVVLVINVDGLVGASCDLIRRGVMALVWDEHKVEVIRSCDCSFFNPSEQKRVKKPERYDTDLPHVEDVLLLARSLI